MQLEDERRHADQYKEQVEKVCTFLVKGCLFLSIYLCLLFSQNLFIVLS
jgi:hypothetical protein